MEPHDSCGILGTPLHSDARSEFKVSAQNRIAPTAAVYSKLRQRAVVRNERKLLDQTSLVATRNDNLYNQDRKPAHLADVMDDEDRTFLRVRAMIKKKPTDAHGRVSPSCGTTSSFLTTSVDLPEIVPKQTRTPLGYRELHSIYSRETDEAAQMQTKSRTHSDYQAFRRLAHASHHGLNSGLGYRRRRASDGEEDCLERHEDSDMVGSRKVLGRTDRTDVGYDSDEDNYMDKLANAGYRNLDATAKLMSRKLKESRAVLTRITEAKAKRALSGVGGTDHERDLFPSFVQRRDREKHYEEWTEYYVAPGFAANPTHNCKKDRLKTNLEVLSPLLQQEYRGLLRFHEHNRSKEADTVKKSIAKAIEEQDAKLRKIRGLVLDDIGARFIAPQALQGQKIRINLHSRRELDSQHERYASKHPEHGETNRTRRQWQPENLLCKRLGVEVPKAIMASSVQEMKAPFTNTLLSSHQAEEFQIHSMTNADGRRLDVSGDYSLLSDRVVIPVVDGDVEVGANDDMTRRPSQRLVQTIFADGRLVDQGKITCDGEASNDTNTGRVSRTKHGTRGTHKTRAADFF